MARGKDSSSDAFARWGTLAPCPSADAGAAANPGAWAGPRSETPPTLTDVRRGGDNGSGDAPAFPPPPLLLLQQGKGQAASRATSVDRGTVAPGAGAKLVSFAEQPGAGGGPVRSVRSVSSAPVQRTSGQPPAFPMANSSTASTRSSGHGVPSSARATPDLNSYMPFSGESGGGVKRGAVAEISSSSYSGDGALHADALLARLAGKAKQAAAAALSASRAGTTAPLLPEPFGVDDSLERQTSLAEGTRRRPKVATSPRTSDDAGGFDCASAAVAPSVAAGAGAGSADGARLAQLCKEDKAKVARLMQDLAKLRAEKDGHKVRFERLRAQNEEIVKEVASLRVKFGQSMQLLRKYQNIVQEGEIAGGRAAVVGDAGNGNGFCAVTDSGMADEIRSLREALQAAERRSQKAETEAVMERASRSAMSEELRKVRADAADLRKQLERHLPTPTAAAPAAAPSPPRQAFPPPAAAATASTATSAPATWSEAHRGSSPSQSPINSYININSSRRPAQDSVDELRAVSGVRRPPVSSASAPLSNSVGGSGSGLGTLPGEAGIVPQPSHAAEDVFGGVGWLSSGDASAGGAGKRGHGGSGTADAIVVGVSTIDEVGRGGDTGPIPRRGGGGDGDGDGDGMGSGGEGEERALAATAAIGTLQKQVEALKQELAMVGVRQLALAAGATPGVLGGARKNAEHWGGSSFGAISQKKFQRSEKASTRGKGDYDEKDSRRGPVVLQVREGVKGGVSCYSGGSGSENSEDSSSRASRNGGSVDENARGGWERSDHGEVDRRGSKGLAAGFRSPSGSVSGLRGTTHLEEEEDEEEERRERSLSRGISTATARRPRTWFETASDDLRDGSSGSDSDRVLKNLGRRGSKGVDIKEEQQEPRHCGAHRSASARRRKTGVVRDELDDEACGGTAPGHYRSGRGGGGDAGAAAPPKLRVSWSSVSVRSEETTELGDDDETNLGDATDPGRRRRRGAASSVAPAQAPRGRHRGGVVAPRTDAFPFPKPPTTAVSPPLSSEISRRREGGAPQASSGLIRGHLDNRDHRDSSAAGKERYRGGSCRWVSRDVDRPGDTSSTYSTASVASRRAVFNTRRLPREVDVKRGGAPAAKAGAAAGPSSDRVGGCREGGRHDDRKPSHHADRVRFGNIESNKHSRNLRGPDGGGSSRGFFDKSLLDLIDDIEGEEGGVDGARFDPDDDAKIRTASRRAVDPRRRDRQHRGVSGAGMGYL